VRATGQLTGLKRRSAAVLNDTTFLLGTTVYEDRLQAPIGFVHHRPQPSKVGSIILNDRPTPQEEAAFWLRRRP